MIIQNAAQCNVCDEIIVSKHRHDFVTCSCGNVSVDGGQSYLRRAFKDKQGWLELSWELPDDLYEACATAVQEAIDTDRNKYGIANAVMRQLRSSDRIIADREHRVIAQHEDELMVAEPDGTVNRYKKIG